MKKTTSQRGPSTDRNRQAPTKEGTERHEPGKPTRGTPPQADPETVKIAKQQGTSQRGFTDDAGPEASAPGALQPRR